MQSNLNNLKKVQDICLYLRFVDVQSLQTLRLLSSFPYSDLPRHVASWKIQHITAITYRVHVEVKWLSTYGIKVTTVYNPKSPTS